MSKKALLYIMLGCSPALVYACKPQVDCKSAEDAIRCMNVALEPAAGPVAKAKYTQCKAVVNAKLDWSQSDAQKLIEWAQTLPDIAAEWSDFTRKFQAQIKVGGKLNIDKSAEPGKALKSPSTSPTGAPGGMPPPQQGKLDPSKGAALKNLWGGGSASPASSPPLKPPPSGATKPKFGGAPPSKMTFPSPPPIPGGSQGGSMSPPPPPPQQHSPIPDVEAGFSTDGYLYAHEDLVAAMPSTDPTVRKKFASDHYASNGLGEKRAFEKLPPNFTPEEYLAINTDVAAHAPQDPKPRFIFAIKHYLNHGKGEGRAYHKLPVGFSAAGYLSLHPDVAAHAPQDPSRRLEFAMAHYFHNGQHEGRAHGAVSHLPSSPPSVGSGPSAPPGFSAETYLRLHPDVASAAPGDRDERARFALKHYLENGRNEGRAYTSAPPPPPGGPHNVKSTTPPPPPSAMVGAQALPPGFVPSKYLELNPDVAAVAPAAGVERDQFAVKHYLENGRNEGRKYSNAPPPPPPPPPPGKSLEGGSVPPPPPGNPSQTGMPPQGKPNTGALFGDINKGGFQLKKTVKNDRSAPKTGQ